MRSPPGHRRPRATRVVLAATLFALLLPSPARAADDEPVGRASFLLNCARCHGESGDGQGTETLDRPARSFRAGGFSFGNTPEAVFRTLSHGIPGSPMPSFELLPEDERRALAEYVLSLGPPRSEASDEQTELVVGARAVVARGLLPPIAAAGREHPRGLLVGTPDGLSYEYAADDLRLLGVRIGRFVQRTDWTGRGGTPLQPLGRLVLLQHEGSLPATYSVASDTPTAGAQAELSALRCELVQTRVEGETCTITGLLLRPDGSRAGLVDESCHAIGSAFAAGFLRTLTVPLPERGALRVDLGVGPEAELVQRIDDPARELTWIVLRTPGLPGPGDATKDGEAASAAEGVRCLGLRLADGATLQLDATRGPSLVLRAAPGELLRRRVEVVTLLPSRWESGDELALLSEPLR